MLLRYVVCGGCVDALSPAAAPCSASDDMTAVVSGVSAAAFKASAAKVLNQAAAESVKREAERKRELSAVIQSHLAGDGSNLSFVRVGEAAIASALAEAEAEQARAAYLKI